MEAVSSPSSERAVENIKEATKFKEEGNELFKQKEYKKAIRKYRTVFAYVNGLLDSSHELAQYTAKKADGEADLLTKTQSETIKALKVSCYSNLAQCYLFLNKPEQCIKCCSDAEKILKDESNAKILYRKGQAYMMVTDFEKAKPCLVSAIKLEPNNKSMRNTLEEFKIKYKEWSKAENEKQKDLFGGKF
mmetsp:Transcript_12983/g.16139  ORF Transcript_12983/g.16139 Transcript_12983/m.16139 type:complete len:190 (-) Transcript_12983:828-1397(-)